MLALVIWVVSNAIAGSGRPPPAASDCPDLKAMVGIRGVPRPVPSSLASKPSPRRVCATSKQPPIGMSVCPSSHVVLMPLCIRRVRVLANNGKDATGVGVLTVEPPPVVSAVSQSADRFRYQAAIAIEVGSEAAASASATAKRSGNTFPRLSARRRMPRQAFALK